MALGYVKRRAEQGADTVLLIDSLTRMGRAYNAMPSNSGRTLSGGLDIRALEIPKKIFGSARKIENGGSLTIIATCLVETNSKMDDVIFEEFKGTGNMELVLDRDSANDRVFPAINIPASGTRNEEKFIKDSLEERNLVRRYLLKKNSKESMVSLLQVLKRTKSNLVNLMKHKLKEYLPQIPEQYLCQGYSETLFTYSYLFGTKIELLKQ